LLCGYQLLLQWSIHETGWQQGLQHALAAGHMFALPQLGPELLAPNPAPLTLLLCPAAKHELMSQGYQEQRTTHCTFTQYYMSKAVPTSNCKDAFAHFAWKVDKLLRQHDCLAAC